MKKVQDHGFRIAEVPVHHFHRTYGKSQFFNFPRVARTLVDLRGSGVELVVRRSHLRAAAPSTPQAPRRAPVTRLPRLLPRPQGPGHRRARLHRLATCAARLADLGAQVTGGRQPAARLRRQPLQPRRLRGQGPHQHRRRARPRHGVPGARPGGPVQPGRPGQPHRLHDRPLHRPRDQLPQPALDPRGRAQAQPRARRSSSRARARSTAGRSTCRWTRRTCCSPTT